VIALIPQMTFGTKTRADDKKMFLKIY